MRIENLQLFCDLVETHSFTRAAEKNGITTPAVTQMLDLMEYRIGQVLVSWNHQFFKLTPAGEIFYQYASEIVRHYADAVRRLQQAASDSVIELAACHSIFLHQLPPVQKQFQQKYPAVQINVRYGLIDRVHEHAPGAVGH
jgi:DNA-binding transcriptional LysR family regulator